MYEAQHAQTDRGSSGLQIGPRAASGCLIASADDFRGRCAELSQDTGDARASATRCSSKLVPAGDRGLAGAWAADLH
jgi:hypothetical protein